MADTLPDLLRDGLEIVFVGINPSVYSVERGHYFARPGNRFWPCFSRSTLSAPARRGIGATSLTPEHDRRLLEFGIGFTDVVKRATARADELSRNEFDEAVGKLVAKIERHRPRIACFHGKTGYLPVQRVLAPRERAFEWGAQPLRIGATHIFVVPNPSGLNAHFTRADQIGFYDRLSRTIASLRAR
jgi:TDG/mug DNA glycosylase family protein